MAICRNHLKVILFRQVSPELPWDQIITMYAVCQWKCSKVLTGSKKSILSIFLLVVLVEKGSITAKPYIPPKLYSPELHNCYFLYIHKQIRSKVAVFYFNGPWMDQSVPLITVTSFVYLGRNPLCIPQKSLLQWICSKFFVL